MAAFIPSRRDAEVNEAALANVRDDKLRESRDGFDGTWVAHPDLVPVAREVFDEVLGDRPNQLDRDRSDVRVSAEDLLDVRISDSGVTSNGVRNNVSVALQYLESWLRGSGAVGINNLMEDTAPAEISPAQHWQWIRNAARVDGERTMTADLYREVRDRELAALEGGASDATRYSAAADLLDSLVLGDVFTEFLTIPGSRYLELEEVRQGATR
jgi:malate synthase